MMSSPQDGDNAETEEEDDETDLKIMHTFRPSEYPLSRYYVLFHPSILIIVICGLEMCLHVGSMSAQMRI